MRPHRKGNGQCRKLNRLDHIKIPDDFDYDIQPLSHEAKEKLDYIKPTNLSQPQELAGSTPAISVYFG